MRTVALRCAALAAGGVILEAPELAFRTPDRSSQQFPLTDVQKNWLQTLMKDKFRAEFAELDG